MTTEAAATLLSLPTLLWSGVIAAVISLASAVLAVVLSNRSNERRLREQLLHDAAERHRDRIAALRKKVYLELFEKLSVVGGHLGALAGKDPITENLAEPLQAALAQLGKIQLVGAQQTALLAGELSSLYGESLFRLVLAAIPMHDLKIEISFADQTYQRQAAESDRSTHEIRAIHESSETHLERLRALQASLYYARKQCESALQQRSQAWDSFNALQRPFMQAVMDELKLLGPAQAKLMDAMRQEIGLTSDLDFMLQLVDATQSRMRSAVDAVFAELAQQSGAAATNLRDRQRG